MHRVYHKLADRSSDLCQGDIIDAKLLRPALVGHQDYMAQRPDFLAFCVMTQTCDLVTKSPQVPAEYITLAVIRLIRNVFERNSKRDTTKRRLESIVEYQQNKQHYFYLPAEPEAGITEASVVDLRVTFALHNSHYKEIVAARNIGMDEHFASNLGWMTSYIFSRIAMPEWDAKRMNDETLEQHIDGLLQEIKDDGVVDKSALEIRNVAAATRQL
jgi:hypothetical protein